MKTIHSVEAPEVVGPYSQAIEGGGMVFVSAQLPLDPKTMEMVANDVEIQARQVLDNLGYILKEAGLGFEDVAKTTIYLKNMNDFSLINAVYADYFPTHKPARSTVEVARLPRDARVTIDLIAVRK